MQAVTCSDFRLFSISYSKYKFKFRLQWNEIYNYLCTQVVKKRWNAKRLTYDERKAAVQARKDAWLAKIEKGEATLQELQEK